MARMAYHKSLCLYGQQIVTHFEHRHKSSANRNIETMRANFPQMLVSPGPQIYVFHSLSLSFLRAYNLFLSITNKPEHCALERLRESSVIA